MRVWHAKHFISASREKVRKKLNCFEPCVEKERYTPVPAGTLNVLFYILCFSHA